MSERYRKMKLHNCKIYSPRNEVGKNKIKGCIVEKILFYCEKSWYNCLKIWTKEKFLQPYYNRYSMKLIEKIFHHKWIDIMQLKIKFNIHFLISKIFVHHSYQLIHQISTIYLYLWRIIELSIIIIILIQIITGVLLRINNISNKYLEVNSLQTRGFSLMCNLLNSILIFCSNCDFLFFVTCI